MLTRSGLRWAGTAWIVLVVALSLQPLRLRATSHGSAGHLVLHLVLFGSAAVGPLLLSGNRIQEAARALSFFCLAGAVEFTQSWIYRYPHPEWKDFEVDGIGVLIAFLAIRFCRIRSAR
jgi:hypothetical protein